MSSHTPKKVLLLAASLGSGHLRAAEAIAGALRSLDPSCSTRLLDIKPLISPALRFFQFHGYEFLIEWAPWAWRFLYQSSLLENRKYAAPEFLLRHGNQRLLEELVAFSPDVIVSTQINCHELSYFMAPRLSRTPRRLAVITDYDAHPVWSKLPAEIIVVGHSSLAEKLHGLGVGEGHLVSTGIPIDAAFQQPQDRAALQARFHLNPETATVLVMGGSVGFGELDRVVDDLLKGERPLQVLAVAGRNAVAQRRLENLQKRIGLSATRDASIAGNSLQVFGFVDFIPELMTVADCFVTKPGGLATTEALAKRLPMLFVNPIAGHEEKNAQFFVRHGAAISVDAISKLRPALASLFQCQGMALARMREAASVLAQPNAALNLAEKILEDSGET